ncbi:hypothetical protein L207DRAFT_187150 [Hyaloscypha variabilis F]|uniref:Uncharacterized protein n=1 Tax=Hyaloscypha variabilis (strain UAMH 11265 / GT02V1 / F) TaxID=1149755 RepID=A0A2J6R001_HYAVF|nr:hypothetical protein L207DRAFT_187150 [Hyaloscypha variabilis F]
MPKSTSSACCGRCLGTGGSFPYQSARGQWRDGIVLELGDILDYKAPPLISIREIFEHITEKLVSTYPEELEALCNKFANTPLKILTCCSGTKSPILGLTMVQKSSYEKKLVISHEASAEIKPERAAVLVGLRRCGRRKVMKDIDGCYVITLYELNLVLKLLSCAAM